LSKPDPVNAPEVRLPPKSKCIYCREAITLAREVPTARQTWELVEPLRPDADTVNVERHLPTQFQLTPPKLETSGLFPIGYANVLGVGSERHRELGGFTSPYPVKQGLPSPTFIGDPNSPGQPGLVSPQSPSPYQPSVPLRSEPSRQDVSGDSKKKALDDTEPAFAHLDSSFLTDPPPFSRDSPVLRRQAAAEEATSIHTPRTVPLVTSNEKGKSRWRLKFTGAKKPPVGASAADSSSLSSTALEAQRLEEIPLSALLSTQKTHTRGKLSRNINVYLSHNSTFGLFWTQLLIHVWDVGTSPPTMMRAILPESTCILAAVGRVHLAYVIGTRDQKLTVRILLSHHLFVLEACLSCCFLSLLLYPSFAC
jgi:hypothetical protein